MNDTFDEFGASLKFGTVSASKPGFARVRLPDLDNMRTMWLPIAYPKTLQDQCCWTYDNGEHVAVLLDARGEDGVILGAVYSDADKPPVTDPNKFAVRFKDGALLEYDRGTHVLTVTGVQKVVVQADAEILLQAGAKVTVSTPEAEFSGNVLVKGKLVGQGGMAVSGGGGAAAVISGKVEVEGDIHASGSVMDSGGNSNHHSH
ncbi:phage baseplate assembly protein V [Chromobacterium alkanivorans]|uniref:phage baseplate assembly protein V n=1 Tax=Chromobacterium alkanivorans TaxID=1071719 RepID=UPI002167F7FB|nr:phage baseplate assembly protein V [Chromobacterium alkanivorans]MCS3806689.1 phage baseplate assembly protein V [Chromobacterium alkanivorans]MCS3821139.1 phage baseplate assembly protein V [Chromobacterium alkanivorans]MCS3875949.1 phage baseplate assembly protein V [Chromobacterium alkanivorans]